MSGTRLLLTCGIAAVMVLVSGSATPAKNLENGPPEVKRTWAPKIPPQAEKNGTAATVTMLVLVRKDGSVGPATVMNCDPCAQGFESSARQSVRRWNFLPARQEGAFVDAYTVVEVGFRVIDAAPRNRYRSRDWSYVSATSGGVFSLRRWNVISQWQREWQWAGVFPGHPWYVRTGGLKSPVESGGGWLRRPADSSEVDQASVRPASEGEMYRRRAAGSESIQVVGVPGVVRPTSFGGKSSSTSGGRRLFTLAPSRSVTSPSRRSTFATTRRAPTSSKSGMRSTTTPTSRTRKK